MANNRDRQKRWQARQAAAGRKRFTVVVDRDVYDILVAHKAHSGESLSEVINRAVRQLPETGGAKRAAAKSQTSPPPEDGGRGIDEARSMIRRLLTLGGRRSGQP